MPIIVTYSEKLVPWYTSDVKSLDRGFFRINACSLPSERRSPRAAIMLSVAVMEESSGHSSSPSSTLRLLLLQLRVSSAFENSDKSVPYYKCHINITIWSTLQNVCRERTHGAQRREQVLGDVEVAEEAKV